MKSLLWTIYGLAATAAVFAAELEKDAPCGDNVDCSQQCFEGRFHLVSDEETGVSFFGCSRAGVNNYRVYNCQSGGLRNNTATQLACEAATGRYCTQCVVLNSNVNTFGNSCLEQNAANKVYAYGVSRDVSFNTASQLASC